MNLRPQPHHNAISLAKAVGILLMVLGHAHGPFFIRCWMVMFHMPLFFFLSGYCFKENYLTHCQEFILRRVKGLYIPFVKWSIVFLLLHNVFCDLGWYNGQEVGYFDLRTFCTTFVRCFFMNYKDWTLGAFWFIRQLLYASILSLFAIKYLKNLKAIILLSIAIAISFAYFDFRIRGLDFNKTTFSGVAFFVSGYAFRQLGIAPTWKWIVGGFAITCLGSIFWRTSILTTSAVELAPYYVSGVAGSVMTLFSCQFFEQRKSKKGLSMLYYIGNHTMEILALHFISFRLFTYIAIRMENLPFVHMGDFPVLTVGKIWYWIPYFIVGTCIPILYCLAKDRITNSRNQFHTAAPSVPSKS